MQITFTILLVCSATGLGAAAHVNLQAKYPFSQVLFDQSGQYYELHWNFSKSTIYFAVNVSTTGWVGLGLSPNGQMPGSDVVIGWVDGTGEAYFADRFAEGRYLPPIDTVSQDWFLTNSEEENGYTVLEFSRNFTSCDPQDLDITFSTARVVWSFSNSDPTDPTGAGARRHDYQGSTSINLLGGLSDVRNTQLPDTFFDIAVDNVAIPSASTTYWCASFRLSAELRDTTHYITRFSPRISEASSTIVHHVLVYICKNPLSDADVGQSRVCHQLNANVDNCRQGLIVGGWAVGGEDFVYPEDIAFPVGGTGQEQFAVIEMHYDNHNQVAGVRDSSGLRFYYTTTPPAQRAGILFLGHAVTPSMVVPPRTRNYTVAGICSATCTSSFIPEEGIRIFANLLHTHLAGRALTIRHYRPRQNCGSDVVYRPRRNFSSDVVWEELEPIDQNLNYNFNYQQFTHLRKEHVVLPGDLLVLQCKYGTTTRDRVVLGGESTYDEMCLSFPIFYPRPEDGSSLVKCVSIPGSTLFDNFVVDLLNSNNGEYQQAAQDLISNPNEVEAVLNRLNWGDNTELARSLQDSVLHSQVSGHCSRENDDERLNDDITLPATSCPYVAPDECSSGGSDPLPCCERVVTQAPPPTLSTAGAAHLVTNIGVVFTLLLVVILMT